MTHRSGTPDLAARLVSHTVLGLVATAAVTALLGRRTGPPAKLAAFVITALAHEALDAPAASVAADLGF